MTARLAVYGAGGHSKEVVDLIRALDLEVVGFVDDARDGMHLTVGLPIGRCVEDLVCDAVVLAIGDNAARHRVFDELPPEASTPTLVHPSALVSPSATLGVGCQVMQYVVVNAAATVGDDCILNVACSVAHDCRVGSHSHLAPGCRLGGGSSVGEGCLVGTNAVVLPGVVVGADCSIGAGAVVTKNIPDGAVVVGVPARPLGRGKSGGAGA